MRYTRLTENDREMIDYVFYKSNTQPEYENIECGYPWQDISVFSWNDLKIQIDSQLLKKPLNIKFSPFGRDNNLSLIRGWFLRTPEERLNNDYSRLNENYSH